MSRKTVPLLIVSVIFLLVALSVIVAFMLNTPAQRMTRESRARAVSVLLAGNPGELEEGEENLGLIAATLYSPLSPGGSLNNLSHFLSKDPGRSDFPGAADRIRMRNYMSGDTEARAARYSAAYQDPAVPAWVPAFTGSVTALFDEVRSDVLVITGVPPALTEMPLPAAEQKSIPERVEHAVASFALNWIPSGETVSSYSVDRRKVREELVKNRRFKDRMDELDSGWRDLAVELYRLSVNPRWKIAAQYNPELERELSELTILTLAATLYTRSRDVMAGVPDNARIPGEPESPGILWGPDLSYYKNIPELNGQTLDEVPTLYFAKVNLGYTFRDTHTQTWLNRRKDWLTDYFNGFFSRSVSGDFSPGPGTGEEEFLWRSCRLKAEAIHPINSVIVVTEPFGKKNTYGVRDLAFVRVNLLTNP